jgi:hypothetical protein
MSSGSLASSASASTFLSSTTIPDLHIPSSSSASSSSSSFLPGHPHDYHHLRNDPAAPPPPPPLALAESKKVFDDATAFVRVRPLSPPFFFFYPKNAIHVDWWVCVGR